MDMVLSAIYVAGPVLRSEVDRRLPIGSLYTELETVAKAHGVQIALPAYSAWLDSLTAPVFTEEIRNRIRKADAMIAVIVRPTSPYEFSGYSIAVEAQEANVAGKPIALLVEDKHVALPRLLTALSHDQTYAFDDPGSLNRIFDYLVLEIKHRTR
jgi:hypothetical protein